jgi:regulator of protease activity HflC (stomatin/prohibitin superfamily)
MLDQVLNVLTILAWVVFILYLLFVLLRGLQAGGVNGAIASITRWRVLSVLLLVIAISLLSASLVFIQPQEVAVLVSLISRDGYREQPFRSGLHWIAPLAEKPVIYPIYWQTYTMSSEALEGEKIGDDSIAARTSDGQAVYLDVSVIYRIDSNDVIRVHIDLQDRYVEDYIRPVLRGIVRTEVSQFTADEVNSSKRKDLETILDETIREAFDEKGFILDRFLLRNIGFSSAYATAIEQKQVAEQERIQREFQAEQIRKLAEGTRDKYKIEAEGQAAAILLKAEAEAEALELIKQALGGDQDLITYRYVEKLGPGVQVMLVPSDNPFLLPLPDLTENMDITSSSMPTKTIESEIMSTITGTEVLSPTIEIIPTPTLTP